VRLFEITARVPTPGDKTIFAPPSTKTAKFEVKNRRKSAEEAKALHLLFFLFLFIFRSNKTDFKR